MAATPGFTGAPSAEAATFNVLASSSGEYIGSCLARYRGTHATQVMNVTFSDGDRPWHLKGELRRGPACHEPTGTVSSCALNGILPATTFLECPTQHDHTCINSSGPYFWAYSISAFTDTFDPGTVQRSDCRRILCLGELH